VNRKKRKNIFSEAQIMKEWAMELSDACGSLLTGKKPNISRIDSLIEQFVKDYNINMMAMQNQQLQENKVSQEDLEDMFKDLSKEEVDRLTKKEEE
jgi:sulfur relay (sulfurtransferase) DsrF/TusC family protein